MIREISVAIENQPGRIYELARALGNEGVTIAALSVADREMRGVLRLVTSDVPRTRQALMRLDVPATVHEVIAVDARDEAGGLAAVLEPLQQSGIDVRYLYAFRGFAPGRAAIVLHTDDDGRSEELLKSRGFSMLSEVAIHG